MLSRQALKTIAEELVGAGWTQSRAAKFRAAAGRFRNRAKAGDDQHNAANELTARHGDAPTDKAREILKAASEHQKNHPHSSMKGLLVEHNGEWFRKP